MRNALTVSVDQNRRTEKTVQLISAKLNHNKESAQVSDAQTTRSAAVGQTSGGSSSFSAEANFHRQIYSLFGNLGNRNPILSSPDKMWTHLVRAKWERQAITFEDLKFVETSAVFHQQQSNWDANPTVCG